MAENIANFPPSSGVLLKDDSSRVNIANIQGPITTTHHNAATGAGNGTDAVGLLGKKDLTVSIKATPGATFVVKFFKSVDGTSFAPVQGVRESDFAMGTSTSASAVTANNAAGDAYEEQWTFSVTASQKFRARVESLSGTNATVTVVSNATA